MNNQSLPKFPLLQYLSFLLTFLIIFSVHFAFSYHFWGPSCNPDISSLVSTVLCAPGFILILILSFIPHISRLLSSFDPNTFYMLFTIITSSCLYGIAGSLVLSLGKKNLQLLGIILIVLFILAGCLVLGITGQGCA
jgi:hypothetical protein